MDLKSRILTALKAKLEGQVFLSEPNNNRQYYLEDWHNNLFDKGLGEHKTEFLKGQGHELFSDSAPDLASVGSSAALAINLFGINKTCLLKDTPASWKVKSRDYALAYEYKAKTIRSARANIDVYLHNGNEHIFIEMKMLEPLKKVTTKSSEAYGLKGYYSNEQAYEVFSQLFDKAGSAKRYDRLQMTKHLLGIYNKFAKEKPNELQHVILLNCYWKPSDDFCEQRLPYQRLDLTEYYSLYQTEAKDFILDVYKANVLALFKSVNVAVQTDSLTAKDMLDCLDLSDRRKGYLTRYDV